MFCIIYIKPKENQTDHCAVHCACPTMYLSARTRILKIFHAVSVTLLIRYGLRFRTAIRIKTSVKLLQSILQTNHYSFQSCTLKPTFFSLNPFPCKHTLLHMSFQSLLKKYSHTQILKFRDCQPIFFYFNIYSYKHQFSFNIKISTFYQNHMKNLHHLQ